MSNKDKFLIESFETLDIYAGMVTKYFLKDTKFWKDNRIVQVKGKDQLVTNLNLFLSNIDWSSNIEIFEVEYNNKFKEYVELIDMTGEYLFEYFTNNMSGVQILFSKKGRELLGKIYGNTDQYSLETINEYIKKIYESMGRKLKILEVGAGTGAVARVILPKSEKYIEGYYFSDISSSFFRAAREEFKCYKSIMEFKRINIKEQADMQLKQKFDLIIASNVIHTLEDIDRILCNLRTYIYNEGYLVVHELMRTNLFYTITFGLLDGWWMYEDFRLEEDIGPILSNKQWLKEFKKCNFEFHDKNIDENQGVFLVKNIN